jgi:hypothetical protein
MILHAKVERVCFPREGEEGTWYILATDQGTIKGAMRWRPAVGEQLAAEGRWTEYQGKKEFRFSEAWHDIPTGSRELLHYACELTKGVGAALEALIWEACGEKWDEIKEGDVPKLKGPIFERFQDTITLLEREKEKAQAVAWLMGVGASRNMAEAAWDQFGESMIGVVNADCYRLAELPHYSFKIVDESIRQNFGITDTDPRRVKSAVLYYLKQLTESGPTVVAWWQLSDKVTGATRLQKDLVAKCVGRMFLDSSLKGFKASQMIALARDHENETAIWNYATLPEAVS